jgi:hypothetical protein
MNDDKLIGNRYSGILTMLNNDKLTNATFESNLLFSLDNTKVIKDTVATLRKLNIHYSFRSILEA